MFANYFQTVYTHKNTLLEVGLPSHTENATKKNVQALCNDVKKIRKSLKIDKSTGPNGCIWKTGPKVNSSALKNAL